MNETFKNVPWAIFGAVVLATAVLVLAVQGQGINLAAVGVAGIAALVTCLGAVVAPSSYSAQALGSGELRRRKAVQLVVAGAVTVVMVLLAPFSAGVAAIFGIVGALFVGAVLPRSAPASAESSIDQ